MSYLWSIAKKLTNNIEGLKGRSTNSTSSNPFYPMSNESFSDDNEAPKYSSEQFNIERRKFVKDFSDEELVNFALNTLPKQEIEFMQHFFDNDLIFREQIEGLRLIYSKTKKESELYKKLEIGREAALSRKEALLKILADKKNEDTSK